MARKPTPAGAAASTPAADTTNTTDTGTTAGDNAGSGTETAGETANNGTDTSSSTGEQAGSGTEIAGDTNDAGDASNAVNDAGGLVTAGLFTTLMTTGAAISTDTPGKLADEVGTIEVRILLDHEDYRPNDVALVTPGELRFALEGGWADPDPSAVAFAKSLVA